MYHFFSVAAVAAVASESESCYDWGPHTMLALCRYAKPRSKPWQMTTVQAPSPDAPVLVELDAQSTDDVPVTV